MASLNRVTLMGYLGNDPDMRQFEDDTVMAILRVATTEVWKDRATGERKESTEWHRVVLFRGLAELAAKYLKKGAHLWIEGPLKTRKWTDAAGAERYLTEVVGRELKMLDKKARAGVSQGAASEPLETADEDMPF